MRWWRKGKKTRGAVQAVARHPESPFIRAIRSIFAPICHVLAPLFIVHLVQIDTTLSYFFKFNWHFHLHGIPFHSIKLALPSASNRRLILSLIHYGGKHALPPPLFFPCCLMNRRMIWLIHFQYHSPQFAPMDNTRSIEEGLLLKGRERAK